MRVTPRASLSVLHHITASLALRQLARLMSLERGVGRVMDGSLRDIIASTNLILSPVDHVSAPARCCQGMTVVQLEATGQTPSGHVLLSRHVREGSCSHRVLKTTHVVDAFVSRFALKEVIVDRNCIMACHRWIILPVMPLH